MPVRTDATAFALVVIVAPAIAGAAQPTGHPDVQPLGGASVDRPVQVEDPTSLGNADLDLDPVERFDVGPADGVLDADPGWSVRSLNLYWENDGTVPKVLSDSDRHYTNGSKIEVALNPSAGFANGVRELADRLDPMPGAKVGAGLLVAQHIYTAFDIRIATPPMTARPYAGYLYFGGFVQRSNESVHDHLELDIGVIGEWSGAESTQKFVHSVFPNQDKPRGWGTQLKNELAINVRYQRSWKFQQAQIGRLQLDGIPRLGIDLGNVFIRANADLTFRLGYNLPNDFGPGRLLDYADVTGTWGGDWGFYGFVRGGARGVARNIFLDGNSFTNSRSVDKRYAVAELSAGLVGRCRWFEAGWSVTWLSEEFDTQGNGDSYGSLFARVAIPF